MDISKDNNKKKDPDEVFKAFTETLEVSTSHWNHIDEMYSDIRQGEHEMTDQLGPTYQDISREMRLHGSQRKDMPEGTTLPHNKTL